MWTGRPRERPLVFLVVFFFFLTLPVGDVITARLSSPLLVKCVCSGLDGKCRGGCIRAHGSTYYVEHPLGSPLADRAFPRHAMSLVNKAAINAMYGKKKRGRDSTLHLQWHTACMTQIPARGDEPLPTHPHPGSTHPPGTKKEKGKKVSREVVTLTVWFGSVGFPEGRGGGGGDTRGARLLNAWDFRVSLPSPIHLAHEICGG